MSSEKHREEASTDLAIKVITISDSLAEKGKKEKDESGKIIKKKLKNKGYSVERDLIPDNSEAIESELEKNVKNTELDAIITTGGTGITSRDKTVDIAKELFEKELPGFGELFRKESYREVGSAIILSRATAGIINQKPIFCLPGSPNSVKTGMDLLIPDLAHIVKHAGE